jgi:hypothetical protein
LQAGRRSFDAQEDTQPRAVASCFSGASIQRAKNAVVPTHFQEPHPSDQDIYNQIEDLLTKDVVSFEKSRIGPGEVYKLQDAFGPRGESIRKTGRASARRIQAAIAFFRYRKYLRTSSRIAGSVCASCTR